MLASLKQPASARNGLVDSVPRVTPEASRPGHDLLFVVNGLGHLGNQDQHGFGINNGFGRCSTVRSRRRSRHNARLFVSEVDLVFGRGPGSGGLAPCRAVFTDWPQPSPACREFGLVVSPSARGQNARPPVPSILVFASAMAARRSSRRLISSGTRIPSGGWRHRPARQRQAVPGPPPSRRASMISACSWDKALWRLALAWILVPSRLTAPKRLIWFSQGDLGTCTNTASNSRAKRRRKLARVSWSDVDYRRCNETPACRGSPVRSGGWSSSQWRTCRSTATATTPGGRPRCPDRHRPAPDRSDPAFHHLHHVTRQVSLRPSLTSWEFESIKLPATAVEVMIISHP